MWLFREICEDVPETDHNVQNALRQHFFNGDKPILSGDENDFSKKTSDED